MSLILDALRKMEQERKVRRGTPLNLRPEVLRYRAEVKPRQGKPYLAASVALLLLAAGGGAGFLLKGQIWQKLAQLPAQEVPAKVAPETAPAPPAAVVTEPAPPPATAAPANAPMAPPVTAPVQGSAAQDAAPAPVAAAAEHDALPPKRLRKAASAITPLPVSAGTQEGQGAIPDITVSGIAWQEERSLRRAVLNGTLVAEGAEVSGARVVEIKENRVRLSRGGQIFDVLFSSGLSSR